MSQVTEIKEEVIAEVQETAKEAAETVSEAAETVVAQAEEVKAELSEKAETAAEAVEEKVETVTEAVEEKAEEVKETVEEKAAEVTEAVEEKTAEVTEAVEEKAEEVKAEAKTEATESMADLGEALEASLKQGPPTDDPVWFRFDELLESKEAIPVKIDSVVKGGVTAFVDGVRAFIPASKAATSHVEDLETLKGLETEAVVITAERAGKKLVLSVRDALRRKEKANRAAAMAECVEGAVLEGTVDSLMDYGAFIKLNNGLSGLLHVSQISYERVAKPSDVLKEGDPITVKIIGIKEGKISLSKKALEEAPARKERAPRGDRPEREPRDGERRPRERREKEEVFNYKETGKASTSLGNLLSGIQLD